jgi:parallel beta-helix repeat protein
VAWGLIFLVFLTVSLSIPSWAKTYHVDGNKGNDGHPGSETEPFRTIRRASEVMEPGDKAVIHEGIYHEQIMGGKSGTKGEPITYEGIDREKVILRGSVKVADWKKVGSKWIKARPKPNAMTNVFVLVDEARQLKRVESAVDMPEGTFHIRPDGLYTIRLWGDADPNRDHLTEVYALDSGFYSSKRWGGTAKQFIVLRNMTIEKYGSYGVSAAGESGDESSNWEIDKVTFRYNNQAGIFWCCDDWYVHDSLFFRNSVHGCQINGARVRFINNICRENSCYGATGYGGSGVIVGPFDSCHNCEIRDNLFERNGTLDTYGCGIYLEGRCHDNVVTNNLIVEDTHAGIGFYGGSYNRVYNNIVVNVSPKNSWELCGAFVVSHSREGAPTYSVGNLIAFNTVWGCPTAVAISEPNRVVGAGETNRFVNNLFCLERHSGKLPSAVAAVFERNGWFGPESKGFTKAAVKDWLKRTIKGTDGTYGMRKLDISPIIGVDPMLNDPEKGDFRPKQGSPSINAGLVLSDISVDKNGHDRSAGNAPGLGAYEFVGNSLKKGKR